MSFLAFGRHVSTIKMSYTYTINNIPQNVQTNPKPIPNQPLYDQNQETTKRIIHTQPPTRPTQPPTRKTKPPTTITLPPVPASPRQTTQVSIENKLGTTNGNQSYVCGVQRTQLNAVSFVIGGVKGKYFIMAVNLNNVGLIAMIFL